MRAMELAWHTECFKCTTCGQKFGAGYYVQDGRPYCEQDYYRVSGMSYCWGISYLTHSVCTQIGMLCARCDKVIGQGDKAAIGKVWHKACFTCTQCLQPFGAAGFFNWNGNPYCPEHYRIVKKQEEK